MQLWTKVSNILSNPKLFATKLKKEVGVKKAFLFFMPLLAINVLLTFLVGRITTPILQGYLSNFLGVPIVESYGFLFEFLATIFGYGLGLGIVFLGAGILHIWTLLWGGSEPYGKSFQLYVYTSTPTLLFGWVPIVGGFAWFYDIYLRIVQTPIMYKDISKKKALWMWLIPVILLVLLYIFIGIVFFFIAANGLSSFVGQAFLA
tara:strand:- start:11358 stop:11969 length:612 start_codon:yes stop_codon:yes gene_type:complete